MSTYHYFRSANDPGLYAFTDDPAGEKLPIENGPWRHVAQLSADSAWTHEASKAAVATAVKENGYALWDEPGQPVSSKPVIESDRVEGTAVYDLAGKRIGSIKRLIIEKVSGRVVYADMTFGGFLGLAIHHHTIPWEKLRYDTDLGGYQTDITEEQLKGAPALRGDADSWPDRDREEFLHFFWRADPYWQDHRRR